jgi:hypothetical protein
MGRSGAKEICRLLAIGRKLKGATEYFEKFPTPGRNLSLCNFDRFYKEQKSEKGKPRESVGRKASGLRLIKRYGRRAAGRASLSFGWVSHPV